MGLNALPEIITPKQLAVFLQISEATVKRALKSGKLVGFKAGRDWRIEKQRAIEWLGVSQTSKECYYELSE